MLLSCQTTQPEPHVQAAHGRATLRCAPLRPVVAACRGRRPRRERAAAAGAGGPEASGGSGGVRCLLHSLSVTLPDAPSRTLPDAAHRGVITKSVGGTLVVQLVSTPLRTSMKSRTRLWAHALAAGDGLPNATCARRGISTTVEFVSVRATRGPNDGAVWASYCAERTSVGMLLSAMSRMALDTGGTCQTSQFERMNWRFGAFLWTERGNVGNARRPAAMTLLALS